MTVSVHRLDHERGQAAGADRRFDEEVEYRGVGDIRYPFQASTAKPPELNQGCNGSKLELGGFVCSSLEKVSNSLSLR